MLNEPGHAVYPAYVARLGQRTAVARRSRRHVFTRHEPLGEGEFARSPYWSAVWRNCCNGCVKVNCGEGTAGRRAVVVVGTKTPLAADILVNAVLCPPVALDDARRAQLPRAKDGETLSFAAAAVPAGVLHDGWNGVELFNRGARDLAASDFVWLEVDLP